MEKSLKQKASEWYRSLSGNQRIEFIEKHFKYYSMPYSENQMLALYKKEFGL